MVLLVLGAFTPSAVAGLNSALDAEGRGGDGSAADAALDDDVAEADRDFIRDRFWALTAPLLTVAGLLLLSVAMSCVAARHVRCRRPCMIASAVLGILIGVLELAMAIVVRYHFDDARDALKHLIPCKPEDIGSTKDEDVRCALDLIELDKLLHTLGEKVDAAVVLLLILALTQLVRACSGGVFTKYSSPDGDPHEPLLGIWSTNLSTESYSWQSGKPQGAVATIDGVQQARAVSRQRNREKYTQRKSVNGQADLSEFTTETHASYTSSPSSTGGGGGGGKMKPSFSGRFSDTC